MHILCKPHRSEKRIWIARQTLHSVCKKASQYKRLGRCQLLANLIPELRKCDSQPIYKSNDFRLADGRCHHSIRRLGRSRTALLSRFFLHYKLYDSTSPLYTASTGSPTCEHISGFAIVSCSSAELGLAQPQQLFTCSVQLRSSPVVGSLDTAGAHRLHLLQTNFPTPASRGP